MNLFQLGRFTLHSGETSRWKIECDALTEEEWTALAYMLSEKLPPFNLVLGCPRGGMILAHKLQKYQLGPTFDKHETLLLVDDVLTTGTSMEELRQTWLEKGGNLLPDVTNIIGAVIFARKKCPEWITPLFQMP